MDCISVASCMSGTASSNRSHGMHKVGCKKCGLNPNLALDMGLDPLVQSSPLAASLQPFDRSFDLASLAVLFSRFLSLSTF